MALNAQSHKLLALAKRVRKLFPGYQIGGINPGIELVRWEKHLSGKSSAVDHVYLSEMAATCLLEGKAPKRRLRKDL